MMKKRRLVKGKIYRKRKISKKLLIAKRWRRLVTSPRGIEVKQNVLSVSHAFKNQIAANNNALADNVNTLASIWPSVGTSDTQRIGDTINVKNISFQIMLKLKPQLNQAFIRVIIYTSPYYETINAHIGFWKFGISTLYPPTMCSVDRESYNVLYDKTISLNASGANNSTLTAQLGQGTAMIRGSIPFGRKVELIGGSIAAKNKRDILYYSIHPINHNGTDGQLIVDAISMFKVNYSD